MPVNAKRGGKKVKVGTVIDSDVLKKMKEKSKREGRQISEIIHDALTRYNEVTPVNSRIQKEALNRFCSKPFNISVKELNEILNEDVFTA